MIFFPRKKKKRNEKNSVVTSKMNMNKYVIFIELYPQHEIELYNYLGLDRASDRSSEIEMIGAAISVS